MKRRFTILLAAMLLMSGLSWAQTRTEVTDVLNRALTGVTGTSYTEWSGKTSNSDAVYAGQSAGGNDAIQLRSNNNNSGVITTASGGMVTKVVVTWQEATAGGRTLNVYGKNTAYSAASDLYNSQTQGTLIGTIVCGTSTELTINNDEYEYIGMRSASGALYLTEIDITWENGAAATDPTISAENVSIEYNAESGEIEYTVNNPVEGGVMTATTEAEWLTFGDEGTDFTCEVNEGAARSANVTLIYTYDTDQTVTKNVTVTQDANPNGPGSQANPYTVAQARAAIDAGTGVTDVYATGIVSAIPTAYNSQYGNITFNFVDNQGDTDFLQAYRCGGDEAADVTEGDIVVVYGNLTKYGSTYEFGQGCQLVSLTHPVVTVEAPTFSPAAGTYADAQTVTINCATEDAIIYYTIDGTEPTDASTEFTATITVENTTTIKAIAYVGTESSTVTTATYHINSQANPYTVAQALAFNEYPANGIYVHGIVSTAATSLNNGTLTYYISDNGEATNELEVYKGKDLNNEAFTAVDNIQVGDIVTIYGNVQVYNGTIEFGSGNYLVEFEHPAVVEPSVTVTPNAINAPVEGAEGTLAITYENIEELISFDIQFCDANGGELEGNDPDWIYAEINEPGEEEYYTVSYIIDANEGEARTAYFKVYTFAGDDLEEVYAIVTVNQAEYVAPALDYAELPFEFDGGRADIETTDGLTQEGLDTDYSSSPKLKFKTTGTWVILHFNERPGTLTFDIKGNGFSGGTFTVQTSEDGETYTDLATYTSFSSNIESEEFNNLGENVRYIKWIYTNKSSGNVALGNITLAKPSIEPSISVSPLEINVSAEGQSGILSVTCNNVDASYEIGVRFYENPETPTTNPQIYEDWLEIVPSGGSSNNFSYEVFSNEGSARSAYLTICAFADNGEIVTESQLVTINQDANVGPATGDEYALYTGELVEGDYVICYDNGTWTAAMKNTVESGRLSYTEVTPDNDTVITDDATIVWHIAQNGDYWTIYSADANAYAAGTGVKNKAQMLEEVTDLALWSVDGTETYDFVNKGNDEAGVNAYLRNNTTYGFACYASGTGGALSLYKKVSEPVTESYDLTISGFEAGSKGGYCLIASPVNVDPANVEGMTTGDFDLYYFDEAQDDEWRNWKDTGDDGHFSLVPGKGYLYAKQATPENEVFQFTLTGTPYEGNGIVTLSKTGAEWSGWNLVGNPFGEFAYIDRDFYTMNGDGDKIVPSTSESIQAMEGIFVYAETDGEEIHFSTEAPAEPGEKIIMNVTRNRGNLIDRAIIRFGEGRQLPKFQLNANSTKLYIAEGENEYAVVRSANEGEMPVSFKAAENGTYTLSVNAENVEMNYLHLIDNMTGADVDLLATPSYTFEANTTDYATRFRLVFSGNTNVGSTSSEAFAFFNGNSWVINNEGEATLQVIDMMGRVLSSEQINGSYNNSLNLSAGVYVLRLSNGNTVKTQKVVVD